MNGLPKDWVVRPALDAELKRYMLLAYLQRVNARFAERKLYPYLEDLKGHVTELLQLRRTKVELERNLSGPLLGFVPRTGDPLYEPLDDDALLGIIDEVLDFSIPGLRKALGEGQELREELTEKIRLTPIGIQPLKANEGWLLLRLGTEVRIYAFAMPLFRESQEEMQYRSVHTRFVTTSTVSIAHGYEQIKADLRKSYQWQPNPATFVFESDIELPHIETFMPLVKQMVYEQITTNVA
jgi:hypothetical protein